MTMQLHYHPGSDQVDVYDEDTDGWYRFDSQADVDAWMSTKGDTEYTQERGGSNLAMWSVPVIAGAQLAVAFDPQRQSVRFRYNDTVATSGCIIGPRASVLGGIGYQLLTGQGDGFATTAELYVAALPGSSFTAAAVLSIATIGLTP